MSLECAKCKTFVCWKGRPELAPENCPMNDDFPQFEALYSTEQRRYFANQSALIESLGYCRWTRVREVAEFATRMGYTRVGVAHCPDMTREADLATAYLSEWGIDTRRSPENLTADPLKQAQHLAREETQLNIVAGMCVRHEAAFVSASEAPVTVLVARDERYRHNPAAALYTAGGYSHKHLYDRDGSAQQASFFSCDPDTPIEVEGGQKREHHEKRSRIVETMEWAKQLGISHIGISFCIGSRNEAKTLTRVLEANGFRVSSTCCKTGAIPKKRLGILDTQQVRPGQSEMICNPLAQAELLNRAEVQLVLVLGQCVGHDSTILAQVKAPAICIVAKDRVLAHNTVAALYELEGAQMGVSRSRRQHHRSVEP